MLVIVVPKIAIVVVVVMVMVVAVFVLAQSGQGWSFRLPRPFPLRHFRPGFLLARDPRVLWLRKGLDDAATAGVAQQNVYR